MKETLLCHRHNDDDDNSVKFFNNLVSKLEGQLITIKLSYFKSVEVNLNDTNFIEN